MLKTGVTLPQLLTTKSQNLLGDMLKKEMNAVSKNAKAGSIWTDGTTAGSHLSWWLGAHRRIRHLFWECAGLSWSWTLMLPNAAIHSKSMQTWDSLARRNSFPKASWMCQQYVRWTTSLMFRWSFRFAWASCRRIVSKTVEDLADAVAVPATSSTSVTGPCISCFKSCVPNGKSLRWVDDTKPGKENPVVKST